MKGKEVLAVFVLVTLVSACQTISSRAKEELAQPINCRTACEDVQILEAEKANMAKQVRAGVGTVAPVSAVMGILSDDWGDRKDVATGEYNLAIEAKIREIKDTCGHNCEDEKRRK